MDDNTVLIRQFFERRHIILNDAWESEAIRYCKLNVAKASQEMKTSEDYDLAGVVFEQWLYSDLAESTRPCLNIPKGKFFQLTLPRPYLLQVVSVLDISESFYTQYRSNICGMIDDDSSFADPSEKPREEFRTIHGTGRIDVIYAPVKSKKSAVMYELSDGIVTIKAVLGEKIYGLDLNTVPGAKVLLFPRVKCRNRVIKLTTKNCQFLGGCHERIRDYNSTVKILCRKLKLDATQTLLKIAKASAENVVGMHAGNTKNDLVMLNCNPLPSKNNKIRAMQLLATQSDSGFTLPTSPSASNSLPASGIYPRLEQPRPSSSRMASTLTMDRNGWCRKNTALPGSFKQLIGAQYPPIQPKRHILSAKMPSSKSELKFQDYESSVSDVWDAGITVDSSLADASAEKVIRMHAGNTKNDLVMLNCNPLPSKNNKIRAMQLLATQRDSGFTLPTSPSASNSLPASGIYPRLEQPRLSSSRMASTLTMDRNGWSRKNTALPGSVKQVIGAQYPPIQPNSHILSAEMPSSKSELKFQDYESSVSDVWDAGITVDSSLADASAEKVIRMHAGNTKNDLVMLNCNPLPSKNNKIRAVQLLATPRDSQYLFQNAELKFDPLF